MSRVNQKGIAPLILIVLALLGLVIGVWLVQNRTNFLPNAQMAVPNLTKQTAFHLFLSSNFFVTQDGSNVAMSRDSGGSGGSSDSAQSDSNSSVSSGRIVPSRTWFYPGEEFKVNLAVSSDIDSANTFSAIINFPPDLLEVVSVQKENNGSVGPVPQPFYIETATEVVNSNTSQSSASVGSSESGSGTLTIPGRKSCAEVITRACTLDQVQCVKAPCPPQEICKDFPSPCNVPSGWYLEKDKCQSDDDCKGPGQFCGFVSYPPRTDTKVCKTKEYACWSKCTDQQANLKVGDKCNPEEFPNQNITQGDIVLSMRACAVSEQGETRVCILNGVAEKYNVLVQGRGITNITPFCSPTPPACPMYDIKCANGTISTYVGNNNNGCPQYKCMPIPNPSPIDCRMVDCVPRSISEGCQFVSDGSCCGGDVVCKPSPSTGDYFIRFWLPDTGFDNNSGKITLSGGVSGGGVLTVPPSKPIMATITFKAKKAGDANIYVADESVILRNSDSTNILTNKNKLMVQIQEKPARPVVKGDLDGDGIVGFVDFSILLTNWGTDSKKADITGDGKVDIFDFSVMLSNWSGGRGIKPLQRCPEEWIQDMMPGMVGDDPASREYFIFEGKRREMSEFDRDWVKLNCNIKPQPVY